MLATQMKPRPWRVEAHREAYKGCRKVCEVLRNVEGLCVSPELYRPRFNQSGSTKPKPWAIQFKLNTKAFDVANYFANHAAAFEGFAVSINTRRGAVTFWTLVWDVGRDHAEEAHPALEGIGQQCRAKSLLNIVCFEEQADLPDQGVAFVELADIRGTHPADSGDARDPDG